MTMTLKASARLTLAGCLVLVLGTATGAVQGQYSRVVLFGDSLSDTGNAFALLGSTSTPPDYGANPFLVPNAPYARGGQNFSNGAIWIELLARALKVPSSAGPAFRGSSPNASNYATGAARAHTDGLNFSLAAQVGAFLQDSQGVAPSDVLYVFAIGTNDVRDALVAYQSGGEPAAAAVLQLALDAIAQHIAALHAAGARHFLVWNVPDVALSPSLRMLAATNPLVAVVGNELTVQFNTALAGGLAALSLLPEVTIIPLDVYGLVHDMVSDPAAFGFSNVTDACLRPNTPPFTCQQPDEFLFWDGLHPTSAAHAFVARAALEALGH